MNKVFKYLIVGLMLLMLVACSAVSLPAVPQANVTEEVNTEYEELQLTLEALQEQIESQEPVIVTVIEYVEVTPTTDARVLPTAVVTETPIPVVEDCPANNWPTHAVLLIPKWEEGGKYGGHVPLTFSFDCEGVSGTFNAGRGIFNIYATLSEDGMSMRGYMESISGGEQRDLYFELADTRSGKFRGSFFFKGTMQAICGGISYNALPTGSTCKVLP